MKYYFCFFSIPVNPPTLNWNCKVHRNINVYSLLLNRPVNYLFINILNWVPSSYQNQNRRLDVELQITARYTISYHILSKSEIFSTLAFLETSLWWSQWYIVCVYLLLYNSLREYLYILTLAHILIRCTINPSFSYEKEILTSGNTQGKLKSLHLTVWVVDMKCAAHSDVTTFVVYDQSCTLDWGTALWTK